MALSPEAQAIVTSLNASLGGKIDGLGVGLQQLQTEVCNFRTEATGRLVTLETASAQAPIKFDSLESRMTFWSRCK